MSHLAYIALGANLGDREQNLRAALEKLEHTPGVNVSRVSTFIENPAVGGPPDSPAFLNAAAELVTSLAPVPLLFRLLEIERELGRERREKWGPRSIDLDLLLYDQIVLKDANLTLPHPLMHQRSFVLLPLSQIAGEVVHPVLNQTIGELLELLQG